MDAKQSNRLIPSNSLWYTLRFGRGIFRISYTMYRLPSKDKEAGIFGATASATPCPQDVSDTSIPMLLVGLFLLLFAVVCELYGLFCCQFIVVPSFDGHGSCLSWKSESCFEGIIAFEGGSKQNVMFHAVFIRA